MSFESLNLDPQLLRAVSACGFQQPTEIQSRAIPLALQGRDLMASAQTGTGKTAAFVLPAMQRLLTPSPVRSNGPRVLVLTPTRELAMQINDAIAQLGRHTRLRAGSIVGGMPYPPQERLLRAPLDLLVATPGRLMDHMERGRVDFSRLELFVLDEADRMLDMGFIDDVYAIAAALPKQRQTMLFSATLEGDIARIAAKLLNNPERIQIAGVKHSHASISQRVHQADDIRHKHALLQHLLTDPGMSQAIVFTATKRGADQLSDQLSELGHTSSALHGDMNQGARKRTVERMKRGKFRILVATDVAARGLDIKGLSHVINFDLPMVAEDYVHRIGRTGRGGATGIAISLVGPDDWRKLASIEKLTGKRLDRDVIPGLEPRRAEPRSRQHARPDGQRPRRFNHSNPRSKGADANAHIRFKPKKRESHHSGPGKARREYGASGQRMGSSSS